MLMVEVCEDKFKGALCWWKEMSFSLRHLLLGTVSWEIYGWEKENGSAFHHLELWFWIHEAPSEIGHVQLVTGYGLGGLRMADDQWLLWGETMSSNSILLWGMEGQGTTEITYNSASGQMLWLQKYNGPWPIFLGDLIATCSQSLQS